MSPNTGARSIRGLQRLPRHEPRRDLDPLARSPRQPSPRSRPGSLAMGLRELPPVGCACAEERAEEIGENMASLKDKAIWTRDLAIDLVATYRYALICPLLAVAFSIVVSCSLAMSFRIFGAIMQILGTITVALGFRAARKAQKAPTTMEKHLS